MPKKTNYTEKILPEIRQPVKGVAFLPGVRGAEILAYKTPKIDTDNKIIIQRKGFERKHKQVVVPA